MKDNFLQDTSNFKLIVSDFDGTLAGVDHVTTSVVRDSVKRWIDSGKHFTIATGRQYLMIDDECKKMELKDPVIVRGGAEVVDPVTDRVLHLEYIDKEDVAEIKKLLEESGLFFCSFEVNDLIFSDFEIVVNFLKIDFKTLSEFSIQSIPKIHVKPRDPESNKADKFIKDLDLKFPKIITHATHNKQFGKGWDITSVKASKLHGIVKIMELLGVRREEIVGVGDSYNDFPLLEAAGLKVAMGNAHQELKEIADIIIPSHDEDGVAYLINKLLE